MPPPEEDSVGLDLDLGIDDLQAFLKERVGLELDLVADAGMTITVAAALAAVVALAVYLGTSMGRLHTSCMLGRAGEEWGSYGI